MQNHFDTMLAFLAADGKVAGLSLPWKKILDGASWMLGFIFLIILWNRRKILYKIRYHCSIPSLSSSSSSSLVCSLGDPSEKGVSKQEGVRVSAQMPYLCGSQGSRTGLGGVEAAPQCHCHSGQYRPSLTQQNMLLTSSIKGIRLRKGLINAGA